MAKSVEKLKAQYKELDKQLKAELKERKWLDKKLVLTEKLIERLETKMSQINEALGEDME